MDARAWPIEGRCRNAAALLGSVELVEKSCFLDDFAMCCIAAENLFSIILFSGRNILPSTLGEIHVFH